MENIRIKALAMLSGGLDSTLSVKIIQEQGVDVQAVNFNTGFCVADHHQLIKRQQNRPYYNEALRAAAELNIPIEIVDISKEYLNILFNPKYGYGKAMNPCIDCRIFMLKKAKDMMPEFSADFVITGEVLGQRPMSQFRQNLELIEKQSGLEGYIVRPLSAQLLNPSIPEKLGWIGRKKLLRISGRSRKSQIELAKKAGLDNYPQPSGGCCFLLDKNFARRIKDIISHSDIETIIPDQLTLLKVGRHFRLSNSIKLIVGREKAENEFLEKYKKGRITFQAIEYPGALSLLEGKPTQEELTLAARITAYYSDGKYNPLLKVEMRENNTYSTLEVKPLDTKEIDSFRIT